MFVKIITRVQCALFVLCLMQINAYAQLNGTYTLGGASPDFATFTAAVDTLNKTGVSGPVIFNVRTGTYGEQLTIDSIPGANATNTITFQSQTLNANDVTLFYATVGSADNWVVKIDSADYITFKFMTIRNTGTSTYTTVLLLNNTCTKINISDNKITGNTAATTSYYASLIYATDDKLDSMTIDKNTFTNGGYGCNLSGTTSVKIKEVRVTNNTLNSYAGIYLQFMESPLVQSNIISNFTTSAIYLDNCSKNFQILNNSLFSNGNADGIYLVATTGSTGYEGLIANNFIQLESTSSYKGIYLNNADTLRIYYNSIYMTNTNVNSTAFYAVNGDNLKVMNNIFANYGGGYAIYISTSTIFNSLDNNNYYASGNYLGQWLTTNTKDLGAFKALSGKDASSISVFPSFVSKSDLHVKTHWLNAKASPLSEVTTDFDGNTRDLTTPDIGADEFTPGSFSALNGIYTIGSAGNFTTFKQAIDSLTLLGVSGPVTFNVLTGSYSERFSIPDVPGASAINTITFQSATGDSTNVTLTYSSSVTDTNYVVQLYGADYITFQKMTLSATGVSYGIIFKLFGYANGNKILNSVLNGSGTATSLNDRTIFYASTSISDSLEIRNCLFNNGSRGIYASGFSNTVQTKGIKILNNSFYNQYSAISINYASAVEIKNNTMKDFTYDGIYLYLSNDNINIRNNKISTENPSSYGIFIDQCDGTFGNQGIIANNFIQLGSTSTVYGIYLYFADYHKVYHNSIHISSTYNISYAFRCVQAGNITVKNNIFANTGPGYAYNNDKLTAIAFSDYNDLYTNGIFIGNWNAVNIKDLAAFKTASTMDANSVNVHPGFVSKTDLHTNTLWLDGKATGLSSEVSDDIDGQVRNTSTPDIGADEYTSVLTPMRGLYVIGSGGNYITFNAAVNDLMLRGIDSTVKFEIIKGNYYEQVSISNVPGANSTNQIIFTSQANHPDSVKLYYSSSKTDSNWVLRLNGTRYITVKNMTLQADGITYSIVADINGNAQNNTFMNNILIGRSTYTVLTDNAIFHSYGSFPSIDSTIIMDNVVKGGSYGVYFYASAQYYPVNIRITNNTFDCHEYGVYLNFYNAPHVELNKITKVTNRGIYLSNCSNQLKVLKNNINVADNLIGIELNSCNATAGLEGLIANNFIYCGNTLGNSYGIYIYNSSYHNVYNNTVHISTSYTSDKAFYLWLATNINIVNNILSITGKSNSGYAYYVTSNSTVNTSNYNNLYSTGNYLAYWGAGNVENLATLQAASGKDLNSVSANPGFVSDTNLHSTSYWLDNKGTPLGTVTQDIDGDTRGALPDIGADEFTSTSLLPLNGVYTVDPAAGNYLSIDSAVTDLISRGVSGPVTFNISPGSYKKQLYIPQVSGASSTNKIIFQSVSSNPADVVILDSAVTAANNYILNLNGAKFITFKGLTLKSSSTGVYTKIVLITGGSSNINLTDNVLTGKSIVSSAADYNLIHINNTSADSLVIKRNTFNNGSNGIEFWSISSADYAKGLEITDNIFNNQNNTVMIYYVDAPLVNNNTINNPYSNGIYLYYCDNALQVLNNKITGNTNAYGIYIYYCDGTGTNKGLIANNFIQTGLTSTNNGIYMYSSTYQNIYYNSINLTSTSITVSAFYLLSGSNNNVVNNIFANQGGGMAYYVSPSTAVTTSNYNDFYKAGTNLAYWNGTTVTSLSALQAASGKDLNSVSIYPAFKSNSDLHLFNDSLKGLATPLTEVTVDIDGNNRDLIAPVIGADEFTCITPDIVGNKTNVGCNGGSDGAVSVSVSSGTTPYSYLWSNGNTTNQISGVSAGTYTLTVTDILGCFDVDSFTVTQPSAIQLTFSITSVKCNSGNNGAAKVLVTGGTAPYNYSWSAGDLDSIQSGLTAGTYTVTITDSKGCIKTGTANVTEPTTVMSYFSTTNTSCGGTDGTAKVSASGGKPPYSYFWSNGATTNSVSNLAPGNYSVFITDSNGCQKVSNVKVNEAILANFSATNDTVTNNAVNFINLSTGNITDWNWSFGDGTISILKDPYHVFPYAGIFTVCLTASNDTNICQNMFCKNITIGNDTTGCLTYSGFSYLPDTTNGITFFNESEKYSSSFWDFGDGSYSNLSNPYHQYSVVGFYNICLTVYNDTTGCLDTYCQSVKIGFDTAGCFTYAHFLFMPDIGNAMDFGNESQLYTMSFWNFDDGNYSTLTDPYHNYTDPGFYDVCLTVYNDTSGCISNYCEIIKVGDDTNACFIYSDFTFIPDAGNTIYLNNQSFGYSQSYWDFGDGTFSIMKNVSHTYNVAGYYVVCLTVYNDTTGCMDTYCKNIVAGNDTTQCFTYADFTFIPDSGYSVIFNNNSIGYTNSYWEFGDGSTSNDTNDIHTYTNPGFYDVCLTVYDNVDSCMATFCNIVEIVDTTVVNCNAYFTYIVDSATRKVTFQDNSSNNPDFWYWNFGDFSISNNLQNPSYTYSQPGYYEVCLTVYKGNDCHDTYCKVIAVGDVSNSVLAQFNYFTDDVTSTAYFSNQSFGNITQYNWEFGDGQFSIYKNPAHTYADTGLYLVCLTVKNATGATDMVCKNVEVGNTLENPCLFSCVWPGDANYSLEANHYDLMSIGLNYGKTGPVRDSASTRWIGHFANDWASIQINGVNNKHSDCNGDGIIDTLDITAIKDNFAFSHPFQPDKQLQSKPANPDLYFEVLVPNVAPGTEVEVKIMAGKDSISLYGVAYEAEFDLGQIKDKKVLADYTNSWIGNSGTNMLSYDRMDTANNRLLASVTRNNQSDKKGFGEISRLKFTIDPATTSNMLVMCINTDFGVNTLGDSVMFNSTCDTILFTGINVINLNKKVKIYPNPAYNRVTIELPNNKQEFEVEILNMIGQQVYHNILKSESKKEISLKEMSEGLYLIRIISSDINYIQKLQVVNNK